MQFSTVQTTQELFGPAGLAFMKMAAKMNHVGQPMKLLYGVNGHGGKSNGACSQVKCHESWHLASLNLMHSC